MTDSRAANLRALGWIALVAALLAPVALWLQHHIPARPDLRWSITSPFSPSSLETDNSRYQYGFELFLHNQGSAAVEEVRIPLPAHPADVVPYLPDDTEWRLEAETDDEWDPAVLVLGPIPAGREAALRLYGIVGWDLDIVEADGAAILETRIDRPRFREEPWASNWLILSGGLLALGLFLQNLALRRELRHQEALSWTVLDRPATPPRP